MAYTDGYYNHYVGEMKTFDRFDPLLVNLHDSLRSYRSDKNHAGHYNELINAVIALLDAHLSFREKTLTAEVLIGLIKQAERDMRISLAERLATRNDLPTALLHYLAYEDIEVAGPVLADSLQLSDTDLIYIIQSKGASHWQAIANRAALSNRVVMQLVHCDDDLTDLALLRNRTIRLSDEALQRIAQLVTISPVIAETFIDYDGLPRDLAVSIYWHLSVAMRQKIASQFHITHNEIDQALEDCVQDFTDTILKADQVKPSGLMIDVARHYGDNNRISETMLVSVLRRRQGRFFTALFAELTGLKPSIVRDLMKQIGGQGLAVACRAKNISKENFISIFLLSRTIIRSKQAVDADELRMAIRYYDGLTYKVANEILTDSIA